MSGKTLFALVSIGISVLAGGRASAEFDRDNSGSGQKSRFGINYLDKAFNNAIYRYPTLDGTVVEVKKPEIIYVSNAYGPSIYSYPGVGPHTITAFNLLYVNPAYGQAIYSYRGNYQLPGRFSVLPGLID
jgi:hypothetical protein